MSLFLLFFISVSVPSHWSTYSLLSHTLVRYASSPQPPYQPYPACWLNDTLMAPFTFIHRRTEKIARCNASLPASRGATGFLTWRFHTSNMNPFFSGSRMGSNVLKDVSIYDMARNHLIPDGLSSPQAGGVETKSVDLNLSITHCRSGVSDSTYTGRVLFFYSVVVRSVHLGVARRHPSLTRSQTAIS